MVVPMDHTFEHVLEALSQPGIALVALAGAVFLFMLLLWRSQQYKAHIRDYRSRLISEREEHRRCYRDLTVLRGELKRARDANHKLRLMLARKEEELSLIQVRPSLPLPTVGQPAGALATVAESLAVTTERLQAAAERMQMALEIRKAALAKLLAVSQSLRNAIPERLPIVKPEPDSQSEGEPAADMSDRDGIEVVELTTVPAGFPRGKYIH